MTSFGTGTNLTELKAKLQLEVNDGAERTRSAIVTLAPGMAMSYEAKRREAEAYMANVDISPSLIPIIAGEAMVVMDTIDSVAIDILTAAEMWTSLEVVINQARIGGNRAIESATTAAEARAAATATLNTYAQILEFT